MAGEKIKALTGRLLKATGRANLVALMAYEGHEKRRIFTNGKATDGSDIGFYKTASHIKNRAKSNLQTSYVDLKFDGDLQRSMVTGQRGNKAEFGFSLDKFRLIAEGQELQRSKKIFSASDAAIKVMLEAYVNELIAIIKE